MKWFRESTCTNSWKGWVAFEFLLLFKCSTFMIIVFSLEMTFLTVYSYLSYSLELQHEKTTWVTWVGVWTLPNKLKITFPSPCKQAEERVSFKWLCKMCFILSQPWTQTMQDDFFLTYLAYSMLFLKNCILIWNENYISILIFFCHATMSFNEEVVLPVIII